MIFVFLYQCFIRQIYLSLVVSDLIKYLSVLLQTKSELSSQTDIFVPLKLLSLFNTCLKKEKISLLFYQTKFYSKKVMNDKLKTLFIIFWHLDLFKYFLWISCTFRQYVIRSYLVWHSHLISFYKYKCNVNAIRKCFLRLWQAFVLTYLSLSFCICCFV